MNKSNEEKPLSVHDQEIVANALVMAVTVIEPVSLELLEYARARVQRRKSDYDSIGCMFDPFGMESKGAFFDQALMKLDAMIQFRKACDLLRDSRDMADREGVNKSKVEALFG